MNNGTDNTSNGGPPLPPSDGSALAADIARCDGSGDVEDGVRYWREGCETCLRRTAPRPELVRMVEPPAIIVFECEFLIPTNAKCSHGGPANEH